MMRAGVRAAGVLSEVVGVGLVLDGNVALIAESVSPTSPCDHSVLIPRPAFHLPAPFFPPPKDNSEVERSENAQKKQRRREQVRMQKWLAHPDATDTKIVDCLSHAQRVLAPSSVLQGRCLICPASLQDSRIGASSPEFVEGSGPQRDSLRAFAGAQGHSAGADQHSVFPSRKRHLFESGMAAENSKTNEQSGDVRKSGRRAALILGETSPKQEIASNLGEHSAPYKSQYFVDELKCRVVVSERDGRQKVIHLQGTQDTAAVVVPSGAVFFSGEVSAGLGGLLSEDFVPEYGFPLLLADPPWPCKSRGIGYHSMSRKDLVALGALLRPLLHERALLGVWVTNDESIVRFVREELLPAWGAEPQGPTWFWVKGTCRGELACPLTSPHKKPFERLLFARRLANSESDGGVITAQPALIMPPDRFIVWCQPGEHSQKPSLAALLQPYVPDTRSPSSQQDGGGETTRPGGMGLELFARQLRMDWASVGDQATPLPCAEIGPSPCSRFFKAPSAKPHLRSFFRENVSPE